MIGLVLWPLAIVCLYEAIRRHFDRRAALFTVAVTVLSPLGPQLIVAGGLIGPLAAALWLAGASMVAIAWQPPGPTRRAWLVAGGVLTVAGIAAHGAQLYMTEPGWQGLQRWDGGFWTLWMRFNSVGERLMVHGFGGPATAQADASSLRFLVLCGGVLGLLGAWNTLTWRHLRFVAGFAIPYALWLMLALSPTEAKHVLPLLPAFAVLVGVGLSKLSAFPALATLAGLALVTADVARGVWFPPG